MSELENMAQVEQQLNAFRAELNVLKRQLLEVAHAKRELESTTESWRMVGNLMVKRDPKELIEELDNKTALLQKHEEPLQQQVAQLEGELEKMKQELTS